jgi:PAS domain S-box-containing protein
MRDTSGFFDCLFNNSKQNAIIIMSLEGLIEQVNEAFTAAYGYTSDDLRSSHFRILYIEKDQVTRRPEIELNTTYREGASTDENYLVHKDGTPIWVTGESVLIKTENNTSIIKMIHNIHAQKQLERYLLASSELLDSLFDSVQHTGLLILDTQMKTIKANNAFKRLFGLKGPIKEGSRLQQIENKFWGADEIRTDILNAIVNTTPINKEYIIEVEAQNSQRIHVASKLINSEGMGEKQLLLVIKPA